MRHALIVAALVATVPASGAALEQPPPPPPPPPPSEHSDDVATRRQAAQTSRDGTFLPMTLTPRIGDQRVASLALGGYDTGTAGGPKMSIMIEGALANRVALRAGVSYLDVKGGQVGPTVGLRVAILRQEQAGVDLGVSVAYLHRGLPQWNGEPDGQIEALVGLARRIGRFGLFANLVYQQGLDPKERNAQVRLAGLYSLTDQLQLGLDARGYLELTDAKEKEAEKIASDFNLVAGPLVSYSISHVTLLAHVGAHLDALRGPSSPLALGMVALGGLGTSF